MSITLEPSAPTPALLRAGFLGSLAYSAATAVPVAQLDAAVLQSATELIATSGPADALTVYLSLALLDWASGDQDGHAYYMARAQAVCAIAYNTPPSESWA
jgi:hypothetical protein